MSSKSHYHSICWAQQVRILSRSIEVSNINIDKLKSNIENIRKLTLKTPKEFSEELNNLLAKCGIALVYLNHFGESGVNGATFVDGKKIVLGLSVRGNYADSFWFSLFHELYHIIAGDVFEKERTDINESEADLYARNTLIPEDIYRKFLKDNKFEKDNIIEFANQNIIDPGIIVGRLQKDKHIEKDLHNDLRAVYLINLK